MYAYNECKKELEGLNDELNQVQAMSDEEFAAKYKDEESREGYIEVLQDEINYLEPDEEESEEYDEWDDHGFRDEADYNNWRFGNCMNW